MKYKLKTSILCFGVPLCQAHLWFFGGDALPSSSMANSINNFFLNSGPPTCALECRSAKLIYGQFGGNARPSSSMASSTNNF